MDPSTEDLGRQLSTLVTSEPERIAAEAGRFQGLRPDYVHGLLWGLRDAAKQKLPFAWREVLEFCAWVVRQPEAPDNEGDSPDSKRRRRDAREIVADLLSQGFHIGAAEIPFQLRSAAWSVLRPLTDDPDPAPADETTDDSPSMDPVMLSINTVRGEAMHAVVSYSLWARRHIEQAPDGKKRMAQGFDEMPEVREVLDQHLDPALDPSAGIRVVYGQFFPWLYLLDSAWATRNAAKIFPTEETLGYLRKAAWEAYITLCPPFDEVLGVLLGEYLAAIAHIGTFSERQQSYANPEQHLVEHLMVFYWRGKLDLDEPTGLLQGFSSKASDALQGHALAFVGQCAGNTEEPLSPEVIGRLQGLWARRLEAALNATTPAEYSSELAAFGWWMASRKFDDAWSLAQLREALAIAGSTEVDHMVVERLAELAPSKPMPTIECLSLMVDGDREGWHVDSWRNSIRSVLEAVLQSSEDAARQEAIAVIHRMAARGHTGFADLLPDPGW